mgnify:CR=1 FL=1
MVNIRMDRDWKSRDEYERERIEAQKKQSIDKSKTFNTEEK